MSNEKHAWIYDVLLILVLGFGTFFRVMGLNWDQNQHLHPDERFMTMVESALEPVSTSPDQLGPPPTAANQPWRQAYAASIPNCQKWGGYFDTYCSPLNPENRGYPFFVYGDLPTIVVRYVAQWAGQVGYDQVSLIGRQVSALADLLTVLLIYIIAARLYNRRVASLGAAFSALAVMQIQQSHFFTVDTFANLFIFLAVYFTVEIAVRKPSVSESLIPNRQSSIVNPESPIPDSQSSIPDSRLPIPDSRISNIDSRVSASTGPTSLYILPGYQFKVVDAMLTNFHLPKSTLIMLVSAFAGRERVLQMYESAIRAGYRFYSFGDAMLIL